jgi:hypothetical protein
MPSSLLPETPSDAALLRAQHLGMPSVDSVLFTEGEVNTLAALPPRTWQEWSSAEALAPGKRPLGIPVCYLYSAMFQLQRTTCRFTLGRIMPLHKGGPMCQASSYRAITVLNSDNEVLARVLAESFSKVLPAFIGGEQRHTCPAGKLETASFTRNWLRRTCPYLGSVGPGPCWTLPRLSPPLNALFF